MRDKKQNREGRHPNRLEDKGWPTRASCTTFPTNNARGEGHAMLAPFSFAGDSDE
jgi:hypothetical protein